MRLQTKRFRALFTLRNIGGQDAIEAIAAGFQDSSELLKHEFAYCLGQMQDDKATSHLINVLKDVNQEPVVRHEVNYNVSLSFFFILEI